MDFPSHVKIASWNINGIRSTKASVKDILATLNADIVCFQETKITRDQLDEDTTLVDGYTSYFSFSKKRSGYSGVATYCRNEICPEAAEEGLSGLLTKTPSTDCIGMFGTIPETFDQSIDLEGRAILTKHNIRLCDGSEESIALINVYCPRADPDKPERLEFKLSFYRLLERRAKAILQSGCQVIIIGDINTSHKQIDNCEPCEPLIFQENSGRKWLNGFLTSPDNSKASFVDTFRHFHPEQLQAFTCWCTVTGARQTNYGTRIDYAFANKELVLSAMTDSTILPDIEGSDHCPIMVTLRCQPVPPTGRPPSICTKYWPEFAGTQTKLSAFLKAKIGSPQSSSGNQNYLAKVGSDTGTKKRKRQTTMAAFLKNTTPNHIKTASSISKESCVQSKCCPNIEEQCIVANERSDKRGSTIEAWKTLLKGPKPPPLCKGHCEPCVLKVVKKAGPTFNKQFYVCARPEGHSSNPNARCNYFKWL